MNARIVTELNYVHRYLIGVKLQWNLPNVDTIGTKIFVLIREVSRGIPLYTHN